MNPIIQYFRKEQCTRNNCNHQNDSTKKSYVLPFLFLEPKTQIGRRRLPCHHHIDSISKIQISGNIIVYQTYNLQKYFSLTFGSLKTVSVDKHSSS